jgi:divalent metal cation (Fe/Co/Zn/Cd) transporter
VPIWRATSSGSVVVRCSCSVRHPRAVLATAGALGFVGNWLAGRIRTDAGERLQSAALIADGHHARADAYVSLGVIASAGFIAIGVPIADPLVGLAITTIILRITWQAWRTVHGDPAP